MHPSDHELFAYRDQQDSPAQQAAVAAHLAVCPACQSRLTAAEHQARLLNRHFTALDGPLDAPAHSPRAAWVEFHTRTLQSGGHPMSSASLWRRARPIWTGLGVLAVFVVLFSLAPVRAWAGEFLGLFRVQQVTVLPIDTTRLSALSGDSVLVHRIGQMLADSLTITQEPAAPQTASDAAEASRLAGFAVRLPGSRLDAPQLVVQGGTAFSFTINRPHAQALLDELGYSTLHLPASLDGSPIAVTVPTAITAGYGNCPDMTAAEAESNRPGSPGRRFYDCTILVEMPSPTINTPPDLDVTQLAQLGLELTGMSASEAQAYSATIDWASTLVIPIPRNGASYSQVAVDGVTGNLIVRPTDDAPQFALVWVKSGIVYAIGGLSADTAPALEMANSLH